MVAVLRDAGFSPALAGRFVHSASALVAGFAFAFVWQHEAQQGQGPDRPAGEPPLLDPDLRDYLSGLGPFTTDEFGQALDLLIAGFAEQLPTT
jgi:hypothetical protein